LLAVYGAHRAPWPGLPHTTSLHPQFVSLPAAGIDELSDCPWPDPLVPGAVHPVTIALAFNKPTTPGGPWPMTGAWVSSYDDCA
jgi:hypothetical protein